MRAFLVDDHTLIREGLRSLLASTGRVTVVGEAASAKEAFDRLSLVPCDVVLMDLHLPDKSGVWCAERLKERNPEQPILILTMHTDDRMVLEALEAGADGYVVKAATRDELLTAIDTVVSGGTYLHAQVARAVLGPLRGQSRVRGDGPSGREMEVLRLVAQGRNNREIADALHLSQSTVKAHLRALFERLEVADRTRLVVEAIRRGLVSEAEVSAPTDSAG